MKVTPTMLDERYVTVAKSILTVLPADPAAALSIDEIAAAAGLPVPTVNKMILTLKGSGAVNGSACTHAGTVPMDVRFWRTHADVRGR